MIVSLSVDGAGARDLRLDLEGRLLALLQGHDERLLVGARIGRGAGRHQAVETRCRRCSDCRARSGSCRAAPRLSRSASSAGRSRHRSACTSMRLSTTLTHGADVEGALARSDVGVAGRSLSTQRSCWSGCPVFGSVGGTGDTDHSSAHSVGFDLFRRCNHSVRDRAAGRSRRRAQRGGRARPSSRRWQPTQRDVGRASWGSSSTTHSELEATAHVEDVSRRRHFR